MKTRLWVALAVLVGGFFCRDAEAAVYDQIACCYSDTGACTVVPGQITSTLADSSCASPTGTGWLLEVQTTSPISNPHFAQQTTEGNGWVGICPQFSGASGEFSNLCFSATGSPLFSNGSIKLVTFNLGSPYTFALNCTTKTPSGACPNGWTAMDSKTCCGSPSQLPIGQFPNSSGFNVAVGTV